MTADGSFTRPLRCLSGMQGNLHVPFLGGWAGAIPPGYPAHAVSTRPVVPSTVSYEDVREGNDPYRALGHGTHSHLTGTKTVRQRCICQHQAEMGLDGWYGEHM